MASSDNLPFRNNASGHLLAMTNETPAVNFAHFQYRSRAANTSPPNHIFTDNLSTSTPLHFQEPWRPSLRLR